MESGTGIDLRLVLPATTAWLAAWVLIAVPEWAPGSQAALWAGAVCLGLVAWRGSVVRGRTDSRRADDVGWSARVVRKVFSLRH